MASNSISTAGKVLNRLIIVGLIVLSGYLYWQIISLQKQVAHLKGNLADSQSDSSPLPTVKFVIPPGLASLGGHELALINSARAHMLLAEKAASENNYGVAHQETQIAENDLHYAEQGASSQSRNAVGTLQAKVADLERRFQAAAKAFSSS
jgi:hypothetical protein